MSSSESHNYTRDEFLAEFYPDPADKAGIAAGMEQLRAEQRAFRLAEMRRRLGVTQAQVAARIGITQGRVSAIEHAKPGTTELRTSSVRLYGSCRAWCARGRTRGRLALAGQPGPPAGEPGVRGAAGVRQVSSGACPGSYSSMSSRPAPR